MTPDPMSVVGAGNSSKELLQEVYKDGVQPAVRVVGAESARCVKLVLAPLRALLYGSEKFEAWIGETLARKLEGKPIDELATPDPVIAGPAVLSMAWCQDSEHLRELFSNLLASAMCKSTRSKAHPAFVNVIQQLSDEEALIASHLSLEDQPYLIGSATPGPLYRNPAKPILAEWRRLCKNWGFEDTGQLGAYYTNFVRLGIIAQVPPDNRVLKISERSFSWLVELKREEVLTSDVRVMITDFGRMFFETCVKGVTPSPPHFADGSAEAETAASADAESKGPE